MPRLLKEKYPNCKVYVPSLNLLEKLFGNIKKSDFTALDFLRKILIKKIDV